MNNTPSQWPGVRPLVALILFFGLTSVLWWLWTTQSPPDATDAAGAAIRQVLLDQRDAWNAGDLDRFLEGYWKSEDLTFYSEDKKVFGWEATRQRYRKRYQAEGQEMGFLDFSEIEIDSFGPTAAFVRGRWQLELRNGQKPGGLFTLIVRKFPEGWRITHDHTSARPAAP